MTPHQQQNQNKKFDRQQPQPFAAPPVPEIKIKEVLEGNDPKLLIDEAKCLADRLTDSSEGATTQVRRLFTSFRQIEHDWPLDVEDDPEKKKAAEDAYFELVLFIPKLRYVASKHFKIKALTNVLEDAIALVKEDRAKLSVLMNFFEATVAYYVANSSKNKKN